MNVVAASYEDEVTLFIQYPFVLAIVINYLPETLSVPCPWMTFRVPEMTCCVEWDVKLYSLTLPGSSGLTLTV